MDDFVFDFTFCQDKSAIVDSGTNLLESCRTVVHRVHRGHIGQESLRGADIASRFVSADVLFSGLQRQSVRLSSTCISNLRQMTLRSQK